MMKRLLLTICLVVSALAVVPTVHAQLPPPTQCTSTAVAGGTADALTVPQLPCSATTTLLLLTVSATNTTTTPTLQIVGNGTPAQMIKHTDGSALAVGDLVVGDHVILTNTGTNWLLYPSSVAGNMQRNAANATLPDARNNLGLGVLRTTYYYAENYGSCTWDATHDVQPCVQAAVDAAAAANGGTIVLPNTAATYGISSTITVIDSNIGFECRNATLKWLGSTGGRMMSFPTRYGSTANLRMRLNSVVGCTLDGNGVAADGIYGRSLFKPTFKDVTLTGFNLALTASTPSAPTLGQTAGGAIGATTYYARIAYTDASGHETAGSAEASFAVGANNLLTITSPIASGNATGYNVFVGTAAGQSYLQNASPIAIGTGWTEPTTGLIAGRQIRTFNNSGSAFSMDIVPAVNGSTFGETVSYQNANIEGLQINNAAYTSNGLFMGVYIDATAPRGNASYNNFVGSTLIQTGTPGVGIVCEGCDNNTFNDLRLFATNSIELTVGTYDATHLFSANGMNFMHTQYNGTFIVRGTETYACTAYTEPLPTRPCPYYNSIYETDVTNGTPLPTINAGTNLHFGMNNNNRMGYSFYGTPTYGVTLPGLTVSNSHSLRNACAAHAQGLNSGIFLCSNDANRMLNFWDATGLDEYYFRFSGSDGALDLQLIHPTGTGNFVVNPKIVAANGMSPLTDLGTNIGATSLRFADTYTKRIINANNLHNWDIDLGIGADGGGNAAFDLSNDGTSRLNISTTGAFTLNGATTATTLADTAAGSSFTDPIIKTAKVNSSTLSKTNDAAFATVPGLTVALAAGKTYSCQGHLTVTAAGAGGGIQVTLANADTLTATSISMTGTNWNGATVNAKSTATSLGTAIGGINAVVTDFDIQAAIVVNAAGTIAVQAAQNTADAAATTVGINSTFNCTRVN